MKKWKHVWKTGLAIAVAASILSGCGVTEAISTAGKTEKEYGKPETMVILSTERLRYEDVYTEELWSAKIDQNGTTFEAILLEQVHDFMIELKTMSNMASEQKVELTSREKDLVKEAASKYLDTLGTSHAESFGLELETVTNLYEDYWTAEKLVEHLTSAMNLEVSDSEAKVITVVQIEVSNLETATEVHAKVSEENADFNSIAKEYSETEELKKQFTYGTMGREYETAAYALETGEISGIVEENGKYYILKCISDYDVEATRLRKEEMVQEKKNEAFHNSYQAYKAEHPLTENTELWTNLTMNDCPMVSADFFEIYESVCLQTN